MDGNLPNDQQPTEQTGVRNMAPWSFLKNKKLVIIISIVFVLLVLLIISFMRTHSPNSSKSVPTPTVDITTPQAVILFDSPNINATPGHPTSVTISIDTMSKKISGANIVISYNPNVISSISLTQLKDPTSAISNAFENAAAVNNTKNGMIELQLTTATTTPLQKGRGKIATLTFTTRATNISQANLSFAPSTAFLTKTPGNFIVLQKNILIAHYPINGVFPTPVPEFYK